MHLLLQPPHAKRARERNVAAAAHGVGRHFSARERVPISAVRPIMLPAREMVPDQGSQLRSSSWLGGGARWLHLFGLFLAHLNAGREGERSRRDRRSKPRPSLLRACTFGSRMLGRGRCCWSTGFAWLARCVALLRRVLERENLLDTGRTAGLSQTVCFN